MITEHNKSYRVEFIKNNHKFLLFLQVFLIKFFNKSKLAIKNLINMLFNKTND